MDDQARDDPASHLASLVLSTADSAYQRAVMVLSVCLTSRPEDLRDLVVQVWPDDGAAVAAAVETVLLAPFVEETAAGWRINSDLVSPLAGRFMTDDMIAFRRAHEILVDREREALRGLNDAEPDLIEMESWFVQSRLAFYLAGLNANESAEQFGWAFESAPHHELTPARVWLSSLVFRQRPLLGEYTRVIAFFEGFRAYIAGQRREALSRFTDVISDEYEDVYQAIGLHLYAMCLDRPSERIRDLTKSVDLSDQLGLTENDIMARNSLVVAHLSMARELRRSGQRSLSQRHLRVASELAAVNYERALATQEAGFQAYTLIQRAVTQWALVAGLDGRAGMTSGAQNLLPTIVRDLTDAVALADRSALPDTALSSINQRASKLRDAGQIDGAVADLAEALRRIDMWTDPVVVSHLAKTAGSLQRRASGEVGDRLSKIREVLDSWSSRMGTQ